MKATLIALIILITALPLLATPPASPQVYTGSVFFHPTVVIASPYPDQHKHSLNIRSSGRSYGFSLRDLDLKLEDDYDTTAGNMWYRQSIGVFLMAAIKDERQVVFVLRLRSGNFYCINLHTRKVIPYSVIENTDDVKKELAYRSALMLSSKDPSERALGAFHLGDFGEHHHYEELGKLLKDEAHYTTSEEGSDKMIKVYYVREAVLEARRKIRESMLKERDLKK